jgi:hypothetical protein
MPRSKVRKRNGRAVNRVSPPRNGRPVKAAKMVAQRSLGLMLDELELLLHAVPLTYDPTDIVATIGHHHHSTAVVNFLRTHDVPGIIAAMGGGAMIVPDDGTPTVEADIVQSPTLDDRPIDGPAGYDTVQDRHRFVESGPGQEPTTIKGCIVCPDCYQPKGALIHRSAEPYAGPEDEVTLIGRPPLPARVSGASMAPELRDGEPIEQVPMDVVERVLEGLQRGRAYRPALDSDDVYGLPDDRPKPHVDHRRWASLIGQRMAVPAGAINANTKTHTPFARRFSMLVHDAINMGAGTAVLVGVMLRNNGTELLAGPYKTAVTKRVLTTWDQAETWRV